MKLEKVAEKVEILPNEVGGESAGLEVEATVSDGSELAKVPYSTSAAGSKKVSKKEVESLSKEVTEVGMAVDAPMEVNTRAMVSESEVSKLTHAHTTKDTTADAKHSTAVSSSQSEPEVNPLIQMALQKGPPYPTISVASLNLEARRQLPQHEAKRLMCKLVACDIPVEEWMLQASEYSVAIRDHVSIISVY
jgi:hypothetical protein